MPCTLRKVPQSGQFLQGKTVHNCFSRSGTMRAAVLILAVGACLAEHASAVSSNEFSGRVLGCRDQSAETCLATSGCILCQNHAHSDSARLCASAKQATAGRSGDHLASLPRRLRITGCVRASLQGHSICVELKSQAQSGTFESTALFCE